MSGLRKWFEPRLDLQNYGHSFGTLWVKYVHGECGLSLYETMIQLEMVKHVRMLAICR
jgi:hypothetical protein